MTDLYARDFYSWTRQQADALRRRSANEIDWDRLADEIDSLGISEERELHSRLVVLLTHLLKWIYQAEKRSRSWENTIVVQRLRLARLLLRNPGLLSHEHDEFLDAYAIARREASTETDMDVETFPETPPFTLEDAKNPEFWPEPDHQPRQKP